MKTLGQELEPVLLDLEDELWEYEGSILPPPKFPKKACRAGVKIFMSILMDMMWARFEKDNVSLEEREALAGEAGQAMRLLIKKYTGEDTFKWYKE